MKYVLPIAVVGIIAIAAIFFFSSQKTSDQSMSVAPTAVQTTPETQSEASESGKYKDGTYAESGHYVSPGGPRDIDVSIVLKDDVVTDATFTGHATDPNSMRFQGEFKAGFKSQVVGKKIDDVNVTKVAGSSLSPMGFMDALKKIKVDANKGA